MRGRERAGRAGERGFTEFMCVRSGVRVCRKRRLSENIPRSRWRVRAPAPVLSLNKIPAGVGSGKFSLHPTFVAGRGEGEGEETPLDTGTPAFRPRLRVNLDVRAVAAAAADASFLRLLTEVKLG